MVALKFAYLVKDFLRKLRNRDVENHDHSQCKKERNGQRAELEKVSQGSEGKKEGDSGDEQGSGEQISPGSALIERFPGANDEDDYRCGDYGFQKPASSKRILLSVEDEK